MKLLRRRGFRRTVVHDDVVGVHAVLFTRTHHGLLDTVLAYSETDTVAFRTWQSPDGTVDPFACASEAKIWSFAGRFLEATTRLLTLPPPPGARRP